MPDYVRHIAAVLAATIVAALSGCDKLDDDRIPVEAVNIVFATPADWDIYGVAGAMTWKRFIREERVPSGFPYTASTFTGFGGVLLLSDVMGNPQAYDLACPVERRRDVRVAVDASDEYLAVCPVCHSKYNVFSLTGHPVSGEAASKGYSLRRYRVGSRGTNYMAVSY